MNYSKLLIGIMSLTVAGFVSLANAASYKCTNSSPIPGRDLFRTLTVQNAKGSSQSTVENPRAFMMLDAQKIVGIWTSASLDQSEHYSSTGSGYRVELFREITAEPRPSYAMVSKGDKEPLKHWVTCQKIADTEDPELLEKQQEAADKLKREEAERIRKANAPTPQQLKLRKFCKLADLTSVEHIPNWIDEKPQITQETLDGSVYNILKYPSGAVVKSRKDFDNIDSFTLPPGTKCPTGEDSEN